MTEWRLVIDDVQLSDERWLQFWRSYRGLPHQNKALALLRQHINQADPGLLTEGAEWVDLWRAAPKVTSPNPLKVKWQSHNYPLGLLYYGNCEK